MHAYLVPNSLHTLIAMIANDTRVFDDHDGDSFCWSIADVGVGQWLRYCHWSAAAFLVGTMSRATFIPEVVGHRALEIFEEAVHHALDFALSVVDRAAG